MAIFRVAMEEVIRWEGYYSLDPHDPGGETYSGIARHFWPGWTGWQTIDYVKPLKHNEQVPQLDSDVAQFYLDNFWNEANLLGLYDKIKDQAVATKIFQHHVNIGRRATILAEQVAGSGSFDTLPNCINIMPRMSFLGTRDVEGVWSGYVKALIVYYNGLVANHPLLQRYYRGWITRAETMPLVLQEESSGAGASGGTAVGD